jgi:hypothetical protein
LETATDDLDASVIGGEGAGFMSAFGKAGLVLGAAADVYTIVAEGDPVRAGGFSPRCARAQLPADRS